MRQLTIVAGEQGKGRAFTAALLGYATADRLWPGGGTGNSVRPIYMTLGCSEAEAAPFLANLRTGRKATLNDNTKSPTVFELLKSAGYAFSTQRYREGVCITAYLPELLRIDLGMVDPEGVCFAILPSVEWVSREVLALDLDGIVAHARRLGLAFEKEKEPNSWEGVAGGPSFGTLIGLAPLAVLFCAYLDRRVRAPLVPDPRFYVQVFIAALNAGLATLSHDGRSNREWGITAKLGFKESELSTIGFSPGVAMLADHEQVEALLAGEVAKFYAAEAM